MWCLPRCTNKKCEVMLEVDKRTSNGAKEERYEK
jgi:hypothetical protein